MKPAATLFTIFMTAAVAGAATLALRPLSHPFTIRTTQQGGGFTVDLPIAGSVRGASTTFFTALDITNNSPQPTDVEFLFTPADGSAQRSGLLATLNGFDTLHTDNFLQTLAASGLIPPNAANDSFGTLLLTFTNPSFHTGSEASAIARIFSNAPGGGTYGLAYRARPLQTNGPHSLGSSISGGSGVVSNIGIENLGIDDGGNVAADPVTIQLSFVDPESGTIVGAQPSFTLAPGQVVQINDVFRQFQLPTSRSLLTFVDQTSGRAQIRGYVVIKDITTNDGAFVFMQESNNSTF